jgi:hypothetical protein
VDLKALNLYLDNKLIRILFNKIYRRQSNKLLRRMKMRIVMEQLPHNSKRSQHLHQLHRVMLNNNNKILKILKIKTQTKSML